MTEVQLSKEYLVDISGSSDGSQDKYFKDGYWYKADSKENEGYNEALVSKILACSNLDAADYVTYEQIMINDMPGCRSRDFKQDGEEDISLYRLYTNAKGGDIAKVLAKMDMDDAIEFTLGFVQEQTGLELRTYLANTLALDQLTLNCDRHMNNLCILFNHKTGVFRVAPIFDNGRTFFCGVKQYDKKDTLENNMKKVVFRPFSSSAHLMTSYLRDARTMEINNALFSGLIESMKPCVAKDILAYQMENNESKLFTNRLNERQRQVMDSGGVTAKELVSTF